MAESICIPFTYTYDQFTTFFYDGRVYISDTSYPIGQCCVDIVNMDEEVLDEIDRRVEEFIPAARELLTEKTSSAVAFAQEKLNAVWDVHFYHAGVSRLKYGSGAQLSFAGETL